MTALFATTGASGAAVGTATITAADDLCTITGHGLVDGQQVVTSAPTGGASGVLIAGAPYFVASATADTFQLRYAPGSPVVTFAADGTAVVDTAAAVYEPQGMRQALGGLLYKGRDGLPDTGRFGSRPGVIYNGTGDEVTISGTTVTVADLNIVVNPVALGVNGGPYVCAILSDEHTLTPADGSNDRIDLVVARVRDAAADSTGFIVADTYLLDGVPAAIPTEPDAPDGEFRLARVDVPQSGTGNPTVQYAPDTTVCAGGVLPVADAAGLPVAVRREGMYADLADIDALVRWDGSAWRPVASPGGWETVTAEQTITGTTSVAVPQGRYDLIRVYFRGSMANDADILALRVNGDSTAGLHQRAYTTVTMSTGAVQTSGASDGTSWYLGVLGTGNSCSGSATIFMTHDLASQSIQSTAVRSSGVTTSRWLTHTMGDLSASRDITSLEFLAGTGGIGTMRIWVEGRLAV